jgi:hypothetical protein
MLLKLYNELITFLWGTTEVLQWQMSLTYVFAIILTVVFFVVLCKVIFGIFRGLL